MKQLSAQDLEKLSHNKQVMFALFCAKQVFHLVDKKYKEICKRAIETTELFLERKASKEECNAAAYAAYAAASTVYAASYVASAAASAANDAAYAASAAASAANDAASAANDAASTVYAAYAANAVNAANAANAARLPIIEAQWSFYDQLLNGDKYFEEIVLKG